MSPNEEYQRLYHSKRIEALKEINRRRTDAFSKEFDRLSDLVRKAKYGKRKNYPPLENDDYNDCVDLALKKFNFRTSQKRLKLAIENQQNRLTELAERVIHYIGSPECWALAKRGYIDSYRSQTDPDHYARAGLLPLRDKLERLGYSCEIRTNYAERYYELWSNAQPYQADAARRTITIGEALKSMGRTTNPKVIYGPYFSDKLTSWHYANN